MRAAVVLALLAGCASPLPRNPAALDDDFLPADSRWRGGDAVYSVPLGRDRILWLFGDSFIAAPGVSARAGSRMVRNSLAITRAGGKPEYFWRDEGGRPADAFKPAAGEGWLWPLSGQRLGPKLHLFMFQMIAKGEGAFGFAFLKSVLLIVDNPDDPPASWRTQQLEIPHTRRTPEGDTFFGGASVLHEGQLYVYGVRESRARGKGILLARVDPAAITEFDSWRFFDGKGWDTHLPAAQELYGGGSIEMSVSPCKGGFVSVYTNHGMSPEIVVRRSERPAGPWSDPVVVHRCVEPQWSKTYFCYAAKGHPELDPDAGSLIVSYACNSMSFPEAVRDLRIYRPRFLRIPLE